MLKLATNDDGSIDEGALFHFQLAKPEDEALEVITHVLLTKFLCDINMLIYDGCVFTPPNRAVWSKKKRRSVEKAVERELAKIPGLTRFPLRFKIKEFKLPVVYQLVQDLRDKIPEQDRLLQEKDDEIARLRSLLSQQS